MGTVRVAAMAIFLGVTGAGCASLARGLLEQGYQQVTPLRKAAAAIDLLTGDAVDLDPSDQALLEGLSDRVGAVTAPPAQPRPAVWVPGARTKVRLESAEGRLRAVRMLEQREDWLLVARRTAPDGVEEWEFMRVSGPEGAGIPAGLPYDEPEPIRFRLP
jgi:hypothetical protein